MGVCVDVIFLEDGCWVFSLGGQYCNCVCWVAGGGGAVAGVTEFLHLFRKRKCIANVR